MAEQTDPRAYGLRAGEARGGRWTGTGRSDNPGQGADEGAGLGVAWRRYHCPVCGHQDRVTASAQPANIDCSHCQTPLLVSLPTPLSERASVRVDLDVPKS